MASTTDTPVKGGRRRLDAQLNLVPYVDMLMTIMAFLILTAAWTSVNVLEVQTPANATATAAPTTPPLPALQVTLQRDAIVVDSVRFAEGDTRGVQTLMEQLKKAGRVDGADVSVDDGVPFDDVAGVVDAAHAAGIGAVQLKTAG